MFRSLQVRRAPFALSALLALGVLSLIGPGCGRTTSGECNRLCVLECENLDDCEEFTSNPINREDCIADCPATCDADLKDREGICSADVGTIVVDGSKADACAEVRSALSDVCKDADETKFDDANGDVASKCNPTLVFPCP